MCKDKTEDLVYYNCLECGLPKCAIINDAGVGQCITPDCHLNGNTAQYVYFPDWNSPQVSMFGREFLNDSISVYFSDDEAEEVNAI